MIGLAECMILGRVYRLRKLRVHANKTSDILIGRWWDILIKFVIPCILFLVLVVAILDNIINPYMGYPWWILVVGGVTPCLIIFLLSFFLMRIKSKEAKT